MFQRLFKRIRAGDSAEPVFVQWPPAPEMRPVDFRDQADLGQLEYVTAEERNPEKYEPAIIIALGESGAMAVGQWLAQLSEDIAGPQRFLRVVLLCHDPRVSIPSDYQANVRLLDLAQARSRLQTEAALPENRRQELVALFNQAALNRDLDSFLQHSFKDMQKGIRLVVVGSLVEVETGLLGSVISRARRLSKGGQLRTIVGLLALNSPDRNPLEEGELYAALREAGRFTFSGWHVMPTVTFGDELVIAGGSLLDYLFLIEPPQMTMQDKEWQQASFAAGVGQAMAESLYVLLHPSGKDIWTHMQNHITEAGNLREQNHEALFGTVGIATLHVPMREMEAYVASRLAYAAMFGERIDRPGEGVLTVQPLPEHLVPPSREVLARRWLQTGPGSHPGLNWFLALNGWEGLRPLPPQISELVPAFQTCLAHGLNELLNESSEHNQIIQAEAGLRWLSDYIHQIDSWFKSMPAEHLTSSERLGFQSVLNSWQGTVSSLIQQVNSWQRALLSVATDRVATDSSRSRSSNTDWRQLIAQKRDLSDRPAAFSADPISELLPQSLQAWIQQNQQRSQESLQQSLGGLVRRSLVAASSSEQDAAQLFYQQTVRPELMQLSSSNSNPFKRVRERLKWWVDLQAGMQPQLLLICTPATFQAAGVSNVPVRESRFAPREVERLGATLLELGRMQFQGRGGIARDLTEREWFKHQVRQHRSFLHRANQPLLKIDEPAKRIYGPKPYLLAHKPDLFPEARPGIFPYTHPSDVNEIDKNEASRFTAVGFWLHIPFGRLLHGKQAYETYHHREQYHLYAQERTAARYEQRIRLLTGKPMLLPPSLAMALVHPQLVTLFCQAAFCQLMQVQEDERHERYWTLNTPGYFPPLKIYKVGEAMGTQELDPLTIWEAWQQFALELPHDPSLNEKPAHPLYLKNRTAYLQALHEAVKERRRRPEFKQQCEAFTHSIIDPLRNGSNKNALTIALANVFLVEMEQPVWSGW